MSSVAAHLVVELGQHHPNVARVLLLHQQPVQLGDGFGLLAVLDNADARGGQHHEDLLRPGVGQDVPDLSDRREAGAGIEGWSDRYRMRAAVRVAVIGGCLGLVERPIWLPWLQDES